jgi:RimJ/RimL family protein N-acetyltransferase
MTERVLATVELRDGRKVDIGYASERDAAAMLEYVEAIAGETNFLTFGPGEFGMTVEQQTAFLKSLADPSRGLMLKAALGAEIIGNVMLSRGMRPRTRHVAELGLSVRKDFWRVGIGAALCRTIFAEGKRIGLTKINLRVHVDNVRAIRLYERLGFAHEGRLAGTFLLNGVEFDELAMGLRL